MANDPIHQFQIQELAGPFHIGGYEISFTNSALFMGIAVGDGDGYPARLPRRAARWCRAASSRVGEMWYEFIHNMVKNVLGQGGETVLPAGLLAVLLRARGQHARHVPLFLHGHQPRGGHGLARRLRRWPLVVVVGIAKHGLGWFKLFVPHGVPMVILPFISLIEIISFLSRPVSLGLRLFGNMLAGHIVLKVFAGFVVSLRALGFVGMLGAIAPLVMAVALTALEFLVAFLQAFVFAILTCVYLNDALHTHH